MNINVSPSPALPPAGRLRDGNNKSASVPDFFHGAALKLLGIAQDYRASGACINRAALACEQDKVAALYVALAMTRAFAQRMDRVAREIERGLDEYRADDIDDCKTVYGS